MTMIEVVLIGAAALLIASSLDNTPIVQTFQKIMQGQSIDWSGGATSNQGAQAATSKPSKACTSANEGEVNGSYVCLSGSWTAIKISAQ